MLLTQETLRGVAEGRITLQFRRWRRPTVKAGGTLLTSVGQLAIDRVDEVQLSEITEREALAAGCDSLRTLVDGLERRAGGAVYRIVLRLAGADPRIALREALPESAGELREVEARLSRWDIASPAGPWTRATLETIADRTGVRAGDLAVDIGMDKARFKTNVRKLKGLGLTESLKVGYRLSPRGEAVLDFLSSD